MLPDQSVDASRGRVVRLVDVASVAQEHGEHEPRPAPQSSENDVPRDDTNVIVQPMRALYASIWASGMFDTVAHVTPRSARRAAAAEGMLSVTLVQPGQ